MMHSDSECVAGRPAWPGILESRIQLRRLEKVFCGWDYFIANRKFDQDENLFGVTEMSIEKLSVRKKTTC